MLRELFSALRSLPLVGPSQLATEGGRAFDLMVDFLRSPETLPHPAINALVGLCWYLIGHRDIPMLLDPFEGQLTSLHLLCYGSKSSGVERAIYSMPYSYLDLVRADPLMQCCAIVNMASQGCDYCTRHLDPVHTPQRAQAYEAELLLALLPLAQAEGLPWQMNPYLQGVLQAYPSGLASLPADQRYEPPSYSMYLEAPRW